MDYFNLLHLTREPFSNSPDPDFFFAARQHVECLQKLELSIRLQRGLNVVIANVGTGKTTLCRQLLRRFAADRNIEAHLLLDPSCKSSSEFLVTIARLLGRVDHPERWSDRQLKEAIKNLLFKRGVEQNRVVVLIIDEGQKLTPSCVEALREFLNYETNSRKLFQIVIFAQKEFEATLRAHANFADRISSFLRLEPLSFRDTRDMIRFRVERGSEGLPTARLFSPWSLWSIYTATGGYPRRIVELCHKVLMALIVCNHRQAGWWVVRSCAAQGYTGHRTRHSWTLAGWLLVLLAAIAVWRFSPRPGWPF